jgi:hypothetical protein
VTQPPDQNDADNQPSSDLKSLYQIAGLLLIIFAARSLALLSVNHAEYTDAILQVGQNYFQQTFWPRGYGMVAGWAALLFNGDKEAGGRLVSALGAALAMLPCFYLACWALWGGRIRHLNGKQVGQAKRLLVLVFLLFAASPLVLRWSVRVMTDSVFLAIFWSSIAFGFAAFSQATHRNPDSKKTLLLFGAANLIGLFSTFFRHQGIFLFPFFFCLAVWLCAFGVSNDEETSEDSTPNEPTTRRKSSPILLLCLAIWILWPLMQSGQAEAHLGQVTHRLGDQHPAAPSFLDQSLQVIAMAEAYIYLAPYFFTPVITLLALIGWFHPVLTNQRLGLLLLLALILFAQVLGSQAFFQSFLSRYLLPLIPLVTILAALGADYLLRKTKIVGTIVVATGIIYGLVLGGASLWLQRQTFGDIAEAAVALREETPINAVIYSNETYKSEAGMGAIKLEWWSSRPNILPYQALAEGNIPRGAYVVLSSAYGGPEFFRAAEAQLKRQFRAEVVAGPFESEIVPLLPDVMEAPRFGHQSPMAWIYRFAPQRFRTTIYQLP